MHTTQHRDGALAECLLYFIPCPSHSAAPALPSIPSTFIPFFDPPQGLNWPPGAMFRQSYQSGFLSLLYSIGSKPLSIWSSESAPQGRREAHSSPARQMARQMCR